MKNWILFALVTIAIQTAKGQVGFTASYNLNNFSNWEIEDTQILPANIEAGVSYWFRLPNHRVEFLPEVYYGLPASHTFSKSQFSYIVNRSYIGLRFNTQVYPFDFENDCNCPTFSKQGPDFMKGFFFLFAPGVIRSTIDLKNIDDSKSTAYIPELSFGVGYDIGINDLITISPFAAFGYTFDQKVEAFTPIDIPDTSGNTKTQLGIKVVLRTDYNSTPGWM